MPLGKRRAERLSVQPHHASRCGPHSGRARELIDVERIEERLALHDRVEQSQCEVQRAGMGERVHE